MTPHLRVEIASYVSGGPIDRLGAALRAAGVRASVLRRYSPEGLGAVSRGRLGRWRALLGGYLLFPLQVVAGLWRRRPDVAIVTTNPFYLPLVAVLARPVHRCRVVALVYDLYPDALEGAGLARSGGALSRLGAGANRLLFSRADGVVFIGDKMGEHARARYGEPRAWIVLQTGADPGEFGVPGRSAQDEPFRRWRAGAVLFSYVGNLGRLHDWETLARALRTLRADDDGRARFLVAAGGAGARALREACRDLGDLVRFEDTMPDDAWARTLADTDVALVTLRDEAGRTSIPSKTFSAMAAGATILSIAPPDSDLADTVLRYQCGINVLPGDDGALVRTVRALCGDPGLLAGLKAGAARAARGQFDLQVLAGRWVEFLAAATRGAGDPGQGS